jgi:hypothetical protein
VCEHGGLARIGFDGSTSKVRANLGLAQIDSDADQPRLSVNRALPRIDSDCFTWKVSAIFVVPRIGSDAIHARLSVNRALAVAVGVLVSRGVPLTVADATHGGASAGDDAVTQLTVAKAPSYEKVSN